MDAMDVPAEWKSGSKQPKSEKGQRKHNKRPAVLISCDDCNEPTSASACCESEASGASAALPIKRLCTVRPAGGSHKPAHKPTSEEGGLSDDDPADDTKQERPLCAEILRNLQKDYGNPIQEYLEVDSLICRLPYKKMLTSLCNRDDKCHVSDIPYVTRAYEESFMHEVISKDQRQCARGNMCECMFIDKANPFICIEFLLPGEAPGLLHF